MSMTVIVTGTPQKDSASSFVVLETVFGMPGHSGALQLEVSEPSGMRLAALHN